MAKQNGRHVTTPDENRPSWQPQDDREREMRHWDQSRERSAAPRGYGEEEGAQPRFVQHPGYHGGSAFGRTDSGYGPSTQGNYGQPGRQDSFGQGDFGQRGTQGGHRGKGPQNFTRSDERIREHVNELLTEHDGIDATNLDVQVANGEITVTGTVEDRYQRRMVEDVVEGISGIRDVHMSIKLRGAPGHKPQTSSTTPTLEQNGAATAPDPRKARA